LQERVGFLVFIATVGAVYTLEGGLLVRWALARVRRREERPSLRRPGAIALHALAGIGVLCLAWGHFVEPYWIEVNTVRLRTEELSVPLRIVHISDLHCDRKVRNEPKLPRLINPLEPDLVVFTGDAVNTPDAVPRFRDTLGALKARIGKFAVRGNFDIGPTRERDLFKGTGFREIPTAGFPLQKDGEVFYVAGLTCEGSCSIILPDGAKEGFTVFLHHYPGLVEAPEMRDVDLLLTGHTHGGQVALPFYGAILTLAEHGKKYEAGRYEVGATTLYVNRGIGMEGGSVPRVRFWARPEITVFDILPAGP
jgi:predicted MPP superfamily phosphohydrolase